MSRFSNWLCIVLLSLTVSGSAQVVTETKLIAAENLRTLRPAPDEKKPLLVNFWATWCGPCRVEFPELIEIDAEYRPKGLEFVIVSVDRPTLAETRVADFLRHHKSTMPSYLINLWERSEITKAIRRIAPQYNGGFPFTVLFDANGKIVYQKQGIIDPVVLRRKIEKVLPPNKKLEAGEK